MLEGREDFSEAGKAVLESPLDESGRLRAGGMDGGECFEAMGMFLNPVSHLPVVNLAGVWVLPVPPEENGTGDVFPIHLFYELVLLDPALEGGG